MNNPGVRTRERLDASWWSLIVLVIVWLPVSSRAGGVAPMGGEDLPEPGLLAMWTLSASHATNLGQVDWSSYDQITVVDDVNWPVTQDPFYTGGPTNYFALRLTGLIDIDEAGLWDFRMSSDAGARLFINGALVIDHDANHSFSSASNWVELDSGSADIEIRFLERDWTQGLVLEWRGPSDADYTVVPAIAFTHDPANAPAAEAGQGLTAYWTTSASHATNLGQIDWARYNTVTTERNISWEITQDAFYTDGPTNYFACRLYGTIAIPEDGSWTFNLGSDAGARMFIDGQLVVDDDANHSFRFTSGTIDLTEGDHVIDVRYLERDWTQGLVATWKGPSDPYEEVIPADALTPGSIPAPDPDGGLQAFWNSSASQATTLGEVDWDFYDHTSIPGNVYWPITQSAFYTDGPTNYFALRLMGTIETPTSGSWTFDLGSDAGARLFIDGELVVNDDANHSFRFKAGSIALDAGLHNIEVNFLERDWTQGLVLTWKGPGDDFESVVPSSALRPDVILGDPGGGGLNAYWTTSASHATNLGQVDWANFDNVSIEQDVSWEITQDAFYEGGPTNYFALRIVGTITVPDTGLWTFKLGSDAGARLYLDEELLINDDANHSFRFTPGTVTLSAGEHSFDVRYLERDWTQGLVVTWQGPNDEFEEVIPPSAFKTSANEPVVDAGGGGLRAYWSSGTSHATTLGEVDWYDYDTSTVEDKVAWNITQSAFYNGGPTNYFALKLVGSINIPEPGAWTFRLGSDAGARLFIDDQLVVNDDANHSFRFTAGNIDLIEGEHSIEIRYLERDWTQGLYLTWQGPGDGFEEVVPSSALTPAPLESPGGPYAGTERLRAQWFINENTTSLDFVDWDSADETTGVDNIAWRITQDAFYLGGPTNYFAARLTGQIVIEESGDWTFKLGSDAGARLLINDSTIIDDDANHSFRFTEGTVFLDTGVHDFEVLYLERDWTQGLVTTWQGPSDLFESVIPAEAFREINTGDIRVVQWKNVAPIE
ncbi:MAG: hypothetical protein H6813_05140 [Phycisphaeraceae bacterium]|nr:hypothetical protein [Phycisphaeraceae bacterium]MCB9847769.1 hypothetical protein [Phycisphaeraceae bacterium]